MEQPESEPVAAGQVTQLLHSWRDGDSLAQQQLMEIVYSQLHAIAVRSMRTQRPEHTLRPTELVHEAWLKLDGGKMDFENRAHFLAIAAKAMRCILVDYARARSRGKRLGGRERVPFEEAELTVAVEHDAAPERLLDLDNALNQLAAKDSRKGQLMELVYFGGLDIEEAGIVLALSARTVRREIGFSKAWIKMTMQAVSGDQPSR